MHFHTNLTAIMARHKPTEQCQNQEVTSREKPLLVASRRNVIAGIVLVCAFVKFVHCLILVSEEAI